MNRDQKAVAIAEIAAQIDESQAIFAVDYRGISVPQAAELRAKLAEADTTFRVVKNRLAKRATERAGTAELDQLFQGPTALAFVKGDAVTAAKAIATFGRQHNILEYKGGLMEGAPLGPEQFGAIARLPGLDVLRGQLVGVVASPLTGLTRALASMLSGLAVALGEIAEQGLVGGGAEEAPVETPVEEAPEGEGTEQEAAEPEPTGEGTETAEESTSDETESPEPSEDPGESKTQNGSEETGSEEVDAEGETSEEKN
jgi:large subunit ribosomal protein L10